jgi:hypothetical protein
MTKALYFHTENDAELINAKVKDGGMVIGDKKFVVDMSKPLNLRRKFGMTEPLYLLKWDSIFPARISHNAVERQIKINEVKDAVLGKAPVERNCITTLVFTRDAKNTPESLQKTESLKILGGMLRVKKEVGGLVLLVGGVVIGITVTVLLIYFKFLKI